LSQFIFKTNEKLTTPVQTQIFCDMQTSLKINRYICQKDFQGQKNLTARFETEGLHVCSETAVHFHYKAVDHWWKTTPF